MQCHTGLEGKQPASNEEQHASDTQACHALPRIARDLEKSLELAMPYPRLGMNLPFSHANIPFHTHNMATTDTNAIAYQINAYTT